MIDDAILPLVDPEAGDPQPSLALLAELELIVPVAVGVLLCDDQVSQPIELDVQRVVLPNSVEVVPAT